MAVLAEVVGLDCDQVDGQVLGRADEMGRDWIGQDVSPDKRYGAKQMGGWTREGVDKAG